MKEFSALRSKARDIRDKAIAHARSEYESTLVQIARLEQDLLGRESSRHKKISACIENVIPSASEFTTVDIMTALEAMDGARVWRKRSVDNHLSRLRDKGIIRRVARSRNNEPAHYIRGDASTATRPFENMTLVEVAAEVLGDRKMTATELTVAIVEAGYVTAMTRKALRDAVGLAMRKDSRFTKDGDRWSFHR